MTTKIAFTLPAEAVEGASEVILLGDFNSWNPGEAPKLERQSDGSFKAIAHLEEGHTYHYRFLLNDGRWVNDYNAQSYVGIPGLHIDNCVITVPVSEAKENKIAKSSKGSATGKKAVKTETGSIAKPAKSATTKKAAPKTKVLGTDTVKVKKAKDADKKVESKQAEKPEKAAKKAGLKAKNKRQILS